MHFQRSRGTIWCHLLLEGLRSVPNWEGAQVATTAAAQAIACRCEQSRASFVATTVLSYRPQRKLSSKAVEQEDDDDDDDGDQRPETSSSSVGTFLRNQKKTTGYYYNAPSDYEYTDDDCDSVTVATQSIIQERHTQWSNGMLCDSGFTLHRCHTSLSTSTRRPCSISFSDGSSSTETFNCSFFSCDVVSVSVPSADSYSTLLTVHAGLPFRLSSFHVPVCPPTTFPLWFVSHHLKTIQHDGLINTVFDIVKTARGRSWQHLLHSTDDLRWTTGVNEPFQLFETWLYDDERLRRESTSLK
jgi:hypothetical protein